MMVLTKTKHCEGRLAVVAGWQLLLHGGTDTTDTTLSLGTYTKKKYVYPTQGQS